MPAWCLSRGGCRVLKAPPLFGGAFFRLRFGSPAYYWQFSAGLSLPGRTFPGGLSSFSIMVVCMRSLLVGLLLSGSVLAVDYDNYSEVYNKTANQYLYLFESTLNPSILAGYLNEAAHTFKKSNEFGAADAASVARLKKFYKFMSAVPDRRKRSGLLSRHHERHRRTIKGF